MGQTNPRVVIIGRVNVGKSTLFNKLISAPKAIVSPIAGTTRDRNYASGQWRGLSFDLIDTGGFNDSRQKDEIDQQILEQSIVALQEADVILLVVDARTGPVTDDKKLLKYIAKYPGQKILVVNKVDSNKWRSQTSEFYKLNLTEQCLVSAANGIGTGDLLDKIVELLKNNPAKKLKKSKNITADAEPAKEIKVAVVGKPNVGKSSLINAILGEKRLIVSAQPHTTRDAQDIAILWKNSKIILVDTAGLRRHSKKSPRILEKQAADQSIHSIHQADITILVTDVAEKLSWQDKHLIDEISSSRQGLLILANKWDLITDKESNYYLDYYRRFFSFAKWVPIMFTSTAKHLKLKNILDLILAINEEKHRVITDNALSKLLLDIVKRHKPTKGKGTKHPYIYSLRQIGANPPQFAIKTNFKATLHESYLRFIENSLRHKFGFQGVPIRIIVQKSQNPHDI